MIIDDKVQSSDHHALGYQLTLVVNFPISSKKLSKLTRKLQHMIS